MPEQPRYDISRSYAWNYEHAPDIPEIDVPECAGDWTFLGEPVASPLGIPAGPLLNGRWVLYYAALGFDVLTYKTVRSVEHSCYSLPNLQPVDCEVLQGGERNLQATHLRRNSWAVSFGMPSKTPEFWRRDVEQTRNQLAANKKLVVSVVGTVQPSWTIDELAADYAQCANWAKNSGADAVETNFSCPNVSTCDGQLYQNPAEAQQVAATVRQAIGTFPFIVKIGHVPDSEQAAELIKALAPYVDAFAMTNSIAATVVNEQNEPMFDGAQRGICGAATLDASLEQTRTFSKLITESGRDIKIIGVGGASTPSDVRRYLASGAESVHIATAAMLDPAVAVGIRRELFT